MHLQMSHNASRTQLQLLTFASQDLVVSELILGWSIAWSYLEEVMEGNNSGIYTEDYSVCSCVLLFLLVIFPKSSDVKGRFS